MPETKNNRRVRFTRSALREALIDLILEKPLVSITVKDICARADINRSTFYLHFKDVTDILRTTEDEIIEHMREHTPNARTEVPRSAGDRGVFYRLSGADRQQSAYNEGDSGAVQRAGRSIFCTQAADHDV